ncbi:unnamed protein product [Caenorhabditis sp. 36 PRJEB53466]|nr:unnamed protein product [Caenorhabditis sp. 36 PRJEB53466]
MAEEMKPRDSKKTELLETEDGEKQDRQRLIPTTAEWKQMEEEYTHKKDEERTEQWLARSTEVNPQKLTIWRDPEDKKVERRPIPTTTPPPPYQAAEIKIAAVLANEELTNKTIWAIRLWRTDRQYHSWRCQVCRLKIKLEGMETIQLIWHATHECFVDKYHLRPIFIYRMTGGAVCWTCLGDKTHPQHQRYGCRNQGLAKCRWCSALQAENHWHIAATGWCERNATDFPERLEADPKRQQAAVWKLRTFENQWSVQDEQKRPDQEVEHEVDRWLRSCSERQQRKRAKNERQQQTIDIKAPLEIVEKKEENTEERIQEQNHQPVDTGSELDQEIAIARRQWHNRWMRARGSDS